MSFTKMYAPFAVPVAALMLLVLVAPSVGPVAASSPFSAYSPAGGGGGAASFGAYGASPSPGSAGSAASGSTVFGGGSSGVSVHGLPAGDTGHCYQGRQFKELLTAPPCTPAWVGNNGAATWPGVTATTVNVVYYREKDNAAVQGIEETAGVYANPSDQQAFIVAANKFINAKYELYGRKINIQFFQGACNPAPPDPACYRSDADQIAAMNPKPFAVVYDNSTNTPDFFDELARHQIVSFGGWHFQDSFNLQERPWHYDVYMSGDYQSVLTGEWYCKKLAGKTAQFAGAPDPGTTDLRPKTRRAAILVENYPAIEGSAEHLASVINSCAPNGVEVIPYSSDTTTSTEQSTTIVNKMQNDGITTVLWFSDPIAPVYGLAAMQSQKYYPEQVLVGSGLLDYDVFGQLYQQSAPREWIHAFGPSDLGRAIPFSQTDADIVWHSAGMSGDAYAGANLPWSYFGTIAYVLNQTGPNVNPGTFERAAFGGPYPFPWGVYHDAVHVYFKLGPNPNALGAYAGISDEREVYWDPNVTSPVNGKAGAYVELNGGHRYRPGEWTTSGPDLPPGQ